MKRFTKKYRNILALTALAAPLLYGCSDELFPDGEGNGASADKGLVIYVPKVAADATPAAATRAGGVMDFNGDEGEINSLYLFAYPKDGGERTSINLKEEVATVADAPEGYEGYKLDLATGTYRLYVAANVNISDFATITEEDLKNYHLSIGGESASYLPMSCANSQMKVSYNGEAGSENVTDDAGIVINSGASTRVWADLKFAVAKVRVTVLNDLRPDLTDLTSTTLTNLADASALMSGGTVTTELGGGDFSKQGYYQLPEMKDDLLKVDIDNMTAMSGTPVGGDWAWQGVAYVAERLFGGTATDEPTVNLTFSDNSTKILEIGTKGEGLKRSYFYDYVGTSNGKFKLAVQPWDPVIIAGALHGPYFLHVDHTKIEKVSGGTPSDIWYESNAQIECVSPKVTINGNEVDLFSFTVNPEENKISVSVSPQIKLKDADKITDALKYFTIKAGTIEKRIDVGDLDLSEFLTVGVQNLTIDVREQISSGHYSGSFIIPIRTNLDSFSITDWTDVAGDAVTLCDADGQKLTSLDNIPAEGGVYNLLVNFKGLNDGLTFWQNTAQITFNVKGTGTDGTEIAKPVTVNVLPAVDKYKIHLYAPGWSNPHIYVYQTLVLPATHGTYPNAPVGTNDKDDVAALEYSFTGAVAFRGWDVVGKDGANHNDPTATIVKKTNFCIFTGSPSAGDWEPGTGNWENHYYHMDFCEEYRKNVTCSSCKTDHIDRDWPGIKMQSEGDGWWVFELSGVATPGKALIMFTDAKDDHSQNGDNRYPKYGADGSLLPGIPLFDYPSREGWFDVTDPNPHFSTTKPKFETYKYRIYWPYNSSSWNGLNIWNLSDTQSWGNSSYSSSDFNNGTSVSLSDNKGTYKKYNSTYAYIEFEETAAASGGFNYQRMPGHNENSTVPNSYKLEDGYYCYTITGKDTGYAGKPSGGVDPTPTNTYKFYWPKFGSDDMYRINFSYADGSTFPDYSSTNDFKNNEGSSGNTFYRTLPSGVDASKQIKVRISDGSGSKFRTMTISLSSFTGSGTEKTYTASESNFTLEGEQTFPTGKYRIYTTGSKFKIWVWTQKDNKDFETISKDQYTGTDDKAWDNRWEVTVDSPYVFDITKSGATVLKFIKGESGEHNKKFSDFKYNSTDKVYEYDATSD